MLLAYVLIFLLHLSASTCHATSRNQHLLFAGRGAGDDTALLPPTMIHHHHHSDTEDKAEVLPDYNDVRHYHGPIARRWGGGVPPRQPSASVVELAGIGGSPPPPSLSSSVEPSGVEGAPPPPPGKQDTGAAMEPSPSPMPSSSPHGGEGASSSSSSDGSTTEQEASAASDDVPVHADYDGPMTHPPSHN